MSGAPQGKYPEAEATYQQALAIKRVALGEQHPETARSLYNLGLLYQHQGRHAQALPLLERALTIRQHLLGVEHPSTRNAQRAYEQTVQALSADEST